MKIYHDNKPRFKNNFRVFVTKLNNWSKHNAAMWRVCIAALRLASAQNHGREVTNYDFTDLERKIMIEEENFATARYIHGNQQF